MSKILPARVQKAVTVRLTNVCDQIGSASSSHFEWVKARPIRKAMLRYELKHPVVNDAEQKIWEAYEARSWPTLVLIDPEGNYLGETSGEGKYDLLDEVIGKIVDEHRKKKTLNETSVESRWCRCVHSSPVRATRVRR